MMKQIVVAFNYVSYKDDRRNCNQRVAMKVISACPRRYVSAVSFDFKDIPEPDFLKECGIHHLPILKRDSLSIHGNTRRLPYIKDILENCSKITCDVFGYINSDILVPMDAYDILQKDFDAYIFSRSDIVEIRAIDFLDKKARVIYGGDKHIGADGFFFNKSWWNRNRDKFPPNLILGETEWDTVYRHIIKNSNANYMEKRMLYHVYHDAKWDINSLGGINNRKIWDSIKNVRTS